MPCHEFGSFFFFFSVHEIVGENDLNISHVCSLSSWEGMLCVLFMVVSLACIGA